MSENVVITTGGKLEVLLVPGPHPYVWIGDEEGRCLDTFDLEGSPLTIRRKR